MIDVLTASECCGCGACAAACACSCISMSRDEMGFSRPVVDALSCTECGLCERVCPVLARHEEDSVKGVFWAKSKDIKQREASSSGGVFGLLAHNCLVEGGVVYGAAFVDRCRLVRHVRVDTIDELDAVMRSKYVQSEIAPEVYQQVKEDLQAGKQVIFSGTACQVAGMRNYLAARRVNQTRLLYIDVICHGVPSPRLWEAWIKSLAEGEGNEIHEVNFRSKITGWLSFSVMYKYMTEKDSASRLSANKFADDWYMRAFLSNASLRPSCFCCPSKCSCTSDLTLGDFWGVQSQHPEAFDNHGVSAVIANTDAGLSALSVVKDQVEWGESSFDKVVAGNSALVKSVKPFSEYEEFIGSIKDGCDIAAMRAKWNFDPTLKQRVRGKLGAAKRKVLSLIGLVRK